MIYNTFFEQITKRAPRLLVSLLFIGAMWSCTMMSTLNVTTNLGEDGDGGVAVFNAEQTGTITYSSSDSELQYNYIGYGQSEEEIAQASAHTYYVYAEITGPDVSPSDYLWDGWYGDDGVVLPSLADQTTVIGAEASQDRNGQLSGGKTYTYTATWLVPQVVKVNNQETYIKSISIDDPRIYPNNTYTESISFTLEEDKSADNFILNKTGSSAFSQGSANYSTNNYTIPFVYTVTGIHNAGENYDDDTDDTPNVGTLTLTSQYKGSASSATSKTATISVVENYIPVFSIDESYTATAYGPLTISTLVPSNLNYAAEMGTWSYTIEDQNNHPEFVVSGNKKDDLVIRFTPSENTTKTYTCTLKVTCTFTDKVGVQLPTTKQVIITINSQEVNEPILQFANNANEQISSIQLNTVFYPNEAGPERINVIHAFVNDITYTWTGNNNNYFVDEQDNNLVKLSLAANSPIGEHRAVFKVSAQCQDIPETTADESTETLTDEVTVTAKVDMETPVLKGFGQVGSALLQWRPTEGAESYIVKNITNNTSAAVNTSNLTIDANGEYSYIVSPLTDGEIYELQIIAVTTYKKLDGTTNNNYQKASNIVTVYPNNIPEFITNETKSNTGIYTGTYHPNSANLGFPYEPVRAVNVEAAFSKGKPIFDRLYIFGITKSNSKAGDLAGTPYYNITLANDNSNSNAITPCYIYEIDPDNNTRYKLVMHGASMDIEMNSSTKNTKYFNITANGQKLYFTGFCPYATTGTKWEDNGVVYITNTNKRVDIYLDNVQIYARPRRKDNAIYTYTNADGALSLLGGGLMSMQGSGAAFVLNSTSSNSNTYFHVRQNNIVQSVPGMDFRIDVKKEQYWQTIIDLDIKYTQTSSPIQCLITGLNQKTSLIFDDEWIDEYGNTIHTNGKLELKKTSTTDPAPLIDLGNEKTEVTINGGQIHFENTNNTLAMAYRRVDATIKEFPIAFYGAYTSNPTSNHNNLNVLHDGGSVRLNDGTISSAYSNLKCPTNTKVDGGSYVGKTTILAGATAATDSYENALTAFEVTINNNYGTIDNNTNLANITNINLLLDDLFQKHAGVDDGNYHRTLSMYYSSTGKTVYGHSSWSPNNESKVRLLLPTVGEGIHLPWQICSPEIIASIAGTKMQLGGGFASNTFNRCGIGNHAPYQIDRMLYMAVDEYTQKALSGYVAANNVSLTLDASKPLYETIGNAESYQINNKVYMLLPIEAAKWTLFAAPFDVANVYVIESYPEMSLVNDHGNKRGQIPSENVAIARMRQAQRFMDLYVFWYYGAKGMGGTSDFFGDTEGTYGTFVNSWLEYESKKGAGDVELTEANPAYTPVIEKLIHYNGSNIMDAHYYLYESDGEWTYANNNFSTTWTIPEKENGAIMKQGEVYIMQFPYNTIGGVHNPATTWDYWTGKYLLIESTTKSGEIVNGKADVHTINGTTYVTSALSTENVNASTASLFGNTTFAEIHATMPTKDGISTTMWALTKTEAGQNGNTSGRDIHELKPVSQTNLSPTTGVLLANFTAPENMIAKSINYRTGEVTYEKIDDNNTGDIETGLPTIMGDITLIVEPTSEGLTITPIKEQHVMLFDANGKMIFSKHLSAEENVTLPTGVYVVRGEYEQVKAIKK